MNKFEFLENRSLNVKIYEEFGEIKYKKLKEIETDRLDCLDRYLASLNGKNIIISELEINKALDLLSFSQQRKLNQIITKKLLNVESRFEKKLERYQTETNKKMEKAINEILKSKEISTQEKNQERIEGCEQKLFDLNAFVGSLNQAVADITKKSDTLIDIEYGKVSGILAEKIKETLDDNIEIDKIKSTLNLFMKFFKEGLDFDAILSKIILKDSSSFVNYYMENNEAVQLSCNDLQTLKEHILKEF